MAEQAPTRGGGARGVAYVAVDVRLFRADDGSWWSTHTSVSNEALAQYRGRFARIVLLARVTDQDPGRALPLSDPIIEVHPLRDNRSQRGLIRGLLGMWGRMRAVRVGSEDLLVVRVPEFVSFVACLATRSRRGPRLAFVVAEPLGVAKLFAGGLPGRVLGRLMTVVARSIVRGSDGVVYVTRNHLQRVLPARAGTPTLARSNVKVAADQLATRPRTYEGRTGTLSVVAAGTLDGDIKGFDLLIEAVARARSAEADVRCSILGQGSSAASLRDRAVGLGIGDHIDMPGFVSSRAELFDRFAQADLFAMPSRSEGLPRVLVEAMAAGMAAIGSRAGGIPELLDEDALMDIGDVDRLTELLMTAATNPGYLSANARRGYEVASEVVAATSVEKFEQFLDVVSPRASG